MKNYRQNIITFSLGVAMLAMLTSSPLSAEEKEGVVRISDNTPQTIRQKSPIQKTSVQKTSFSQPAVASAVSGSLAGSSSCQKCNSDCNNGECNIEGCPECNNCDECNICRYFPYLIPHHKLGMLGQGDAGLVSRVLCIFHSGFGREHEFDDEDVDEVKFDKNGKRIKSKKKKNKGRRYKRGHYTKVYAVNPWYSDPRNGRVYAAKNHGIPMTVPLAPNVEHEYNYGWGIPSSRLTPISKPPARSFQPPFPARRYPVDRGRHPYRIEMETFRGNNR